MKKEDLMKKRKSLNQRGRARIRRRGRGRRAEEQGR
jgi:hypothetical protein